MNSAECRDINKQLGEAQQMHQLKVNAQAAIDEAAKQEEVQRELRRKLIRAKADLEVLLLDGKQVSYSSFPVLHVQQHD